MLHFSDSFVKSTFISYTMRFRETLSVFMVLYSIFSCGSGHFIEPHVKQTRKSNYGLKQALVSAHDIITQLSSLANATVTCNANLEAVTKKLNAVCKKIENPEKSEVSLTKKGVRARTVTVDVDAEYTPCVDRLRGHCSELYAEIWCLRSALWKNNHFNDTNDEVANISLSGVNSISKDEGDFQAAALVSNSLTVEGGNLQRAAALVSSPQTRQLAPSDITIPPTGYRKRKEYRTLSVVERQKYHAAVRQLYEDGTFSDFARIHKKGIQLRGVHRGEAFLPWHRAFLAFYEEALREIDPSVSLPYWDSTIDFNMVTPTLSVIWDKEHLGTGFGNVDDGPFANFSTDDNPLKRRIGVGKGSLMKPSRINQIFQNGFCRLGDIFRRLESAHNGVHRWVGSTMARSWSASDPVFYMHHAFIDYIWEKFRERQNSSACGGIDPGTDYPVFDESGPRPTKKGHMPDEPMDAMEFLKNRQGIENFWTTNWYGYEEPPSCSNNCSNSPDIFCDEDTDLCVGVMSEDPGEDPMSSGRRKRQALYTTGSTQLYASYGDTTTPGSICRTQPYLRSCPTPDPPTTAEEIASAMVNYELPMPDKIARIDRKLKKNREKYDVTPPESEPVFFREIGDFRNDCRTVDTAVYDLIIEMLRGRKIVGKRRS